MQAKLAEIDRLVDEIQPQLVEWRRDFHHYAESGWVEFRTASKVAAKLEEWGLHVEAGRAVIKEDARMGVPAESFLRAQEKRALEQGADPKWLPVLSGGFTGVVGVLETGIPGPTVAFRFDMDALDIEESEDGDHLPVQRGFRSLNTNMMHACGHDAHTAIGLGLAKVLMNIKDQLKGTIKLIFQPSEEGVRGAKSMVEAGVLDGVDVFFASHIGTGPNHGEVVCGAYGYLATTKLDVSYNGVASHAGGKPEEGKNALLAAASATLNLHSISRHSAGSSRINVGVLSAGSGRNIIPSKAFLKVETRGETTEINEYVLDQALQIIKGAAIMYGVDVSIETVGEAKSCKSSAELLPYIAQQAKNVPCVHTVIDTLQASGSEDATYMMERVQENGGLASYLIFGTSLAAGHHNEKFDIEEDSMRIAVQTLAHCARNADLLKK